MFDPGEGVATGKVIYLARCFFYVGTTVFQRIVFARDRQRDNSINPVPRFLLNALKQRGK